MTVHKVMCKTCGQPLPPVRREGVYLSPRKAQIFDFIYAHPGITTEGIAWHIYQDEAKGNVIRQHIYQINSMLASTDTKIACQGRNQIYKSKFYVIRAGKYAYA